MPKTKWPVEEAILLRREGWSWTALGAKWVVHPTSIQRYFKRHKINPGKTPTREEVEEARKKCLEFDHRKSPHFPTIRVEFPVLKGVDPAIWEEHLNQLAETYR